MVNEKLKMSPQWTETLAQFDTGETCQFKVENGKGEKAKLRQIMRTVSKNTGKEFTTNTLLGGGFEIKRIK